MNALEKHLNLAVIYILSCVLLSALGIQIFTEATPCPLCLLQRMGMIGVAIAAFLNIYYGSRSAHYGLMLLSVIVGGSVAIRQILLHLCPTFSKYDVKFMSLNLYTWSFIIFSCVGLFVALMLFLRDDFMEPRSSNQSTKFQSYAFAAMFTIVSLNVFTTFFECGLGPCS